MHHSTTKRARAMQVPFQMSLQAAKAYRAYRIAAHSRVTSHAMCHGFSFVLERERCFLAIVAMISTSSDRGSEFCVTVG
jgi:hypothetical protein